MQRSGSAGKLLKCNILKEKADVTLKNTENTANPSSEGIEVVYVNEQLPSCNEFIEECNMSLASEDSLPIMSPPPAMEVQNRCMTPVTTTPTPSTSGNMQRKATKRRYEKTPDVFGQIAAAISAPITIVRESEVSQELEHFCNFIETRLH